MSDHTEIDVFGNGSGEHPDAELQMLKEMYELPYIDPVTEIIGELGYNDGQAHYATGRNPEGVFSAVATPYLRDEFPTSNLLRVLFSQQVEKDGAQVIDSSDFVVRIPEDPENGWNRTAEPPHASVWVKDGKARVDKLGAVPEGAYDHDIQKPVIISNPRHEYELAEITDGPPSDGAIITFLRFADFLKTTVTRPQIAPDVEMRLISQQTEVATA